VPQKRQVPLERKEKKVVAPQSVAARSGFAITCGEANGSAGIDPSTGS
jgi:hypothetical protein